VTYEAEVLADSPTFYWRLGEASGAGSGADASGNGHGVTFLDAPTLGVPGLLTGDADTAAQFSNASTNVGVGSDYALPAGGYSRISFEVIYKPTTLVQGILLMVADDAGNVFMLQAEADGSLTFFDPAGILANGPPILEVGTPMHIVGTYDSGGLGDNCFLWVNGQSYSVGAGAGAVTFTGSGGKGYVGNFDPTFSSTPAADGVIDEAAIYLGTQLDETRIAAHATAAGLFGRPLALTLPLAALDVRGLRAHLSVLRFGLPLIALDVAGLRPHTDPVNFALPLITIDVAGLVAVESEAPVPVPTPAGQRTRWAVHAVDDTGKVYATIPTAKTPQLTWPQVNAPMGAVFSVSIDEPAVEQLPLPNDATTPPREVQIWRNGQLAFFGPVISRRADSNARVWEYTCGDPLYHLQSRFLGEAKRRNYLTNGSFDNGLNSWATHGVVTASSSAKALLGTSSAKLVTTDEGDNYLHQTFVMKAGKIGLALIATAWVFVESFAGPAYGGRGLYIGKLGAGPSPADPDDRLHPTWEFTLEPLDENSAPVGKWSRLTCAVEIPPNTTETMDIRLYAPHGTVYWEAASIVVMESLSLIEVNSPHGTGWDQVEIAHQTVRYLAGSWPLGDTYTKSKLNISTAGPKSGIVKERTYQFSDHQPGYEGGDGAGALDEWPTLSDGFDFEMDVRPNARIFRTHYPSIGKVWARPFVFRRGEPSWCVVGWTTGETIEGTATDVCELGGWGSDAGREEGGYSNPTALGGLTREMVEGAPQDAPIGVLDSIAQSRGQQVSKPICTPSLIMVEPRDPETDEPLLTLIGVMKPGDIITADVVDGGYVLEGTWRVASVDVNADEVITIGLAQ
jgi:hypothetical protein